MAFDAFMKIDGIEGESKDDKHKGWLELIRFGVGIKQNILADGSRVGGFIAERADFSDFIIRKYVDMSSPNLFQACADGTHIKQIIVELYRAGSGKVPFLTYTLKNCLIRKVISTKGGDTAANFPAETVKIKYGKIEYRYTRYCEDGRPSGFTVFGWDSVRNCKM